MVINKSKALALFFTTCVVTRIASSIYYIEDADSLRFALGILDYDVVKYQPHFPGYPVYCFLVKIFYFFTNSLAISFSIVGGVAVFCIIYFISKILDINLQTFSGLVFCGVVFFNPLVWLMSNRYMPDLFGLALATVSFYYLSAKSNIKDISLGLLFAGLLAGVRLSYMPILIVPAFYKFFKSEYKIYLISAFTLGCSLWIIPLISITGLENLIIAASKQTEGHFSDFGGTIFTENNWLKRLAAIMRSIWADGLGGYWAERSWQTMALSLPMVYILWCGIKELRLRIDKKTILVFISFGVVYAIWIYFFQNVLHKSRHVLPLLIPSFIILHRGSLNLINVKSILSTSILIIFFISLISITSNLVLQHKKYNAITRVKNEILTADFQYPIASTPLVNYYLKQHGIKNQFLDIKSNEDIKSIMSLEESELFLIGNFKENFLGNYNIISDSVYYHNPYVNRMWSKLNTYMLNRHE